jgi:hypothetical protein
LHWPLQVPAHAALSTIMPGPPIAVQVPVHIPMHVPSQWTDGSVPGVQLPAQSASHEPWHWAETVADPSHVALASHMPLHWPEMSPG